MLSLLSDDQVSAIAAFDITQSLNLNDPRFGNAGSTEVLCPTCNMRSDACMGHHASLSLGTAMFHPLVYKESQKIINNVCFGCCNELKRVSKSKARRCSNCELVNYGDYIIYAQDTTVAVRQSTKEEQSASLIPYGILPKGYVVSKILVPPVYLRTPEDMEWSTDIQKLYEQLIDVLKSKKSTKNKKTLADGARARCAAHKTQKSGSTASSALCAAYSRIVGAHKKEGVIGTMSGKGGIFRELMLGKRVESSARAVITCDPNLKIDEVAVPKAIADRIKVKVTCSRYNIESLKDLASQRNLWWEGTEDIVVPHNILAGMTFERNLANGDPIMLNRQPSLSRFSMMCFRVVLRDDLDNDVLSINPQVTTPFNADFDGDEMNVFFMSNKVEMTELCNVLDCELTPVQDVVTGCYIMSKDNVLVSDKVWSDCLACCAGVNSDKNKKVKNPEGFLLQRNIAKQKKSNSKTTHNILSMCIRGYDGRELNKKKLKDYIADGAVDLYELQHTVLKWLSAYGLTVAFDSIVTTPRNFAKHDGENPDSFRDRCIMYVQNVMSQSKSGLMNMINSGAKGSETHASHMALAIGQQYVGGREGTFCNRPYSKGLTPSEFFGHQMAAREGVVSTGVGTATTGYLNRRACKILADVKYQYNGTVADEVMVSSFGTYDVGAPVRAE